MWKIMTRKIKTTQALMAAFQCLQVVMVNTHAQKYTPPFIMRQSSTSSVRGLSQQIFMWPSCLKFLQNAKTEGLAKLRFCWVSRLDNKYLNTTTELHSCYQNQKQIFSSKLDSSLFAFCTLSAKCKMHQKKKNAANTKSHISRNQVVEWRWDVGSMQTCMSLYSPEVYCSTSP